MREILGFAGNDESKSRAVFSLVRGIDSCAWATRADVPKELAASRWINRFEQNVDFDQAILALATLPDLADEHAVTWVNAIVNPEEASVYIG